MRLAKQCGKRVDTRLGQREDPAIDGHNPAIAKVSPAPFTDGLRKHI